MVSEVEEDGFVSRYLSMTDYKMKLQNLRLSADVPLGVLFFTHGVFYDWRSGKYLCALRARLIMCPPFFRDP